MAMRIEEAWIKLHAAADLAAARGSLMFHLDLATEVARLAFAGGGIAIDRLATLVDEDGYRVIAFDGGLGVRALGSATFDGAGDVRLDPAPAAVPPRATTMADARATIAAVRFGGAARHAAIVIPGDDRSAPIEGYAIAVGDDPAQAHCGGHWLVTLSSDGRRMTSRVPLAVTQDGASLSAGTLRDATLVVASAVPNEMHTYLSLKHGVPLIVVTEDSGVRWRVDGERTSVAR